MKDIFGGMTEDELHLGLVGSEVQVIHRGVGGVGVGVGGYDKYTRGITDFYHGKIHGMTKWPMK